MVASARLVVRVRPDSKARLGRAAELSQVPLSDVVRSAAEQRAASAGGPPQAGEVAVSCRSGRTLSIGGSSGAHPQPPVSGPPWCSSRS